MMNADQLAQVNALCSGTLMETLGILFVPSPEGTLAATMPVDARTMQPMGLLHGGATVALVESLGSVGSYSLVDRDKQAVVGIEVNANHLRSARSGIVTAIGALVHRGRTTHVWDIRVTDDTGQLLALCRLTNMIIEKRP